MWFLGAILVLGSVSRSYHFWKIWLQKEKCSFWPANMFGQTWVSNIWNYFQQRSKYVPFKHGSQFHLKTQSTKVTIFFETFRFLKPNHDCNPPTGWHAPGNDNFPSSQRRRISLRQAHKGMGQKKQLRLVEEILHWLKCMISLKNMGW